MITRVTRRVALVARSIPFLVRSLWSDTQQIRLFGTPYLIRSNCRKIGVDGRIYVYRERYAESIRRAIERFATKDACFVDVGANTGFFTKYWLSHWNTSVAALEADPATFAILRKNVPQARLAQKAASNASGTARFARRADHGSSGLAIEGEAYIEVPQVTVDAWLAQLPLESGPLIVKIDVEGFDPLVILGMTQTIASRAPAIICEWLHDDRCSDAVRREAIALLEKYHYDFFDVDTGSEISDLALFRGDFCAAPKQLPCDTR
jgi:FkbM family methyltransferase